MTTTAIAEDVLDLPAGDYFLPEPLRVRGPLRLRGAGLDATRLHGALEVDGGHLVLEGVTLGELTVRAGEAAIAGCRLGVVQTGGVLRVEGCEVLARPGAGMLLTGGEALVRRCLVEGNAGDGIQVDGTAAPVLENCLVLGNGGTGIVFAGRSAGEAYGNLCEANAGCGLHVTGEATPVLTENTLRRNGAHGLRYSDRGGGAASRNFSDDNGLSDAGAPTAPAGTR